MIANSFHALAAAAIDFTTQLQVAPGEGMEKVSADLADAAMQFANAASPPEDQGGDFTDDLARETM
jgi:hypothetical protein